MNNLGDAYYEDKDYAEAHRWYEKSAIAGSVEADIKLGNMYYDGDVIEQDYTAARHYLQRPAAEGNLYAQAKLGWMYLNGKGGPPNYSEALRLNRSAAQSDDDDLAGFAMNNLGVIYVRGAGVPQNINENVRWYRRAARKGNEAAAQNLAQYRPGRGGGRSRGGGGGGRTCFRYHPYGVGGVSVPAGCL